MTREATKNYTVLRTSIETPAKGVGGRWALPSSKPDPALLRLQSRVAHGSLIIVGGRQGAGSYIHVVHRTDLLEAVANLCLCATCGTNLIDPPVHQPHRLFDRLDRLVGQYFLIHPSRRTRLTTSSDSAQWVTAHHLWGYGSTVLMRGRGQGKRCC